MTLTRALVPSSITILPNISCRCICRIVPDVDAIFIPELDTKSNPLKSKASASWVSAGLVRRFANAIYNACGARIRDYPITWTNCWLHCRCKPDAMI